MGLLLGIARSSVVFCTKTIQLENHASVKRITFMEKKAMESEKKGKTVVFCRLLPERRKWKCFSHVFAPSFFLLF